VHKKAETLWFLLFYFFVSFLKGIKLIWGQFLLRVIRLLLGIILLFSEVNIRPIFGYFILFVVNKLFFVVKYKNIIN